MKNAILALALAALLAGCGSDSDSDRPPPATGGNGDGNGGGGGSGTTLEVTGDVLAPPGGVALFIPESPFQVALNFFIPEAAAAITGLEPVTGAKVELIRIDNAGAQVGDVLAETTTSISGDYTLTIPAGVNLAGNLVVRITGQGGREMRAQVVDQTVDITPVTEFVLQRFIDNGADLENLTTASVLKLSGQVEEFDLTAAPGSDLSAMLATLDSEVGDFVDGSISLITSQPGDATGFAGLYSQISFDWGFHDSDGQGYSSHEVATWLSPIEFEAGEAGVVTVGLTGEESADGLLMNSNGSYQLRYWAEVDTFEESFPANISSDGVISVEIPFEEDVDGDFGWRSPPGVFRLQKAPNSNLFFGLSNSALVRYETVDTNEDGQKDAVDPAKRSGDEVFYGLETFLKRPSAATTADLVGDFGRVYIGTTLLASGFREVESEQNLLTFEGTGNATSGATTLYIVSRNTDGTVNTLPEPVVEEPFTYAVDADGNLDIGNGGINEDFNFFVLSDMEMQDDANTEDEWVSSVSHSLTLAVKLPGEPLTVSGRVYRVLAVESAFEGDGEMAIHTTRFGTLLSMTSETTATVNGATADMILPGGGSNLLVESDLLEDQAVQVSVQSNGALVINMPDGDGTFTMEGFLNQDGSVGIMQTRYQPTGGGVNSLGVAILVEVTP